MTSQIYGSESSTAEVEAGRAYLDGLVASLSEMEIEVETAIRHGSRSAAGNRALCEARSGLICS